MTNKRLLPRLPNLLIVPRGFRFLIVGLALSFACFGQAVSLSLSSGSASPSTTTQLNLTLNNTITNDSPAALQWTFSYPTADFSAATVVAGPASTGANKTLSCGGGAGSTTCMLWGLNTTAFPNGVVATVTLTVSGSTTHSSSAVQVTNSSAADAAGKSLLTSTTGGTVTIHPGLNGLSCSPMSLSKSATATCTVSLTSAAPSGGAAVSLAASPAGLTIPSSVTVPAGASSTSFSITAGSVSAPTTVTVKGTYYGVSATFNVTVTPPTPSASKLTVSKTSLTSGQSATGTITLTSAAPSGGASVILVSSNPSVASVPASVTVPQGATSATFTVTAGTVSSATSVTLGAAYGGNAALVNITVYPSVGLSRLTVNTNLLYGGQSATGTVTLRGAAPPGGVVVALSSSNSSAVTVPATVTVAAGHTSATFTVKAKTVTSWAFVIVNGTYQGVSAGFWVVVGPPQSARLNLSPRHGDPASSESLAALLASRRLGSRAVFA